MHNLPKGGTRALEDLSSNIRCADLFLVTDTALAWFFEAESRDVDAPLPFPIFWATAIADPAMFMLL